MRKKRFVLLLKKYLEGKLPGKLNAFVDDWFNAIRHEVPSDLTPEEEQHLRQRYLNTIKMRIRKDHQDDREHRVVMMNRASVRWAIAAGLTIFLLAGSYVFFSYEPDIESTDRYAFVENASSTDLKIHLPDSSVVILSPAAELRYFKDTLSSNRNVYLDGDAFFKVDKNANKPFFVHARHLTTKVLGTSFRVETSGDGDVRVMVTEGKVAVTENATKASVIVLPNQEAVYQPDQEKLASRLVEKPAPLVDEHEVQLPIRMKFENEPVPAVFHAMEQLFGVPIEYDRGKFQGCKVTTSLESGDLYNRLDILCAVLNSKYAVSGMKVNITKSGDGCQFEDNQTNEKSKE